MRLELLAPGALLALPLALAAGAAVLVARRRAAPALETLRLAPPPRRATAALAAAACGAAALLVVAAARPTLVRAGAARIRTDAQVFVVFDTSRSMSARAAPGAPSRLDRARGFATRFRAGLAEVPTGVATFSDRVLPALLPTVDAAAFDATVRQAIGIDRPPPKSNERVATAYGLLQELPEGGSYAPGARRRLLVVLTDGESRPYVPARVVAPLRRTRTQLLVVRFWHADERVFAGTKPTSYRPEPETASLFDALGARAVGGRVFGEDDAAAAAAAARRSLGTGPTATAHVAGRPVALGPYAALAGFAVLALLLVRRGGDGRAAPARVRHRWVLTRPSRS